MTTLEVQKYEYFIGVDLSLTGSAAIIIDNQANIVKQELVSTKSDEQIENRFKIILDALDFCRKVVNLKMIYVEGLSYGSKGQAALELAGLHYLFRYSLCISSTPYKIIPPTELKKFLTGKGNSKKELMLLHCYKKFGIEFDSNDLCDAYCLARYAFHNHMDDKDHD